MSARCEMVVDGDIGGGYPEAGGALAKLSLKWMIEQTGPTGLHYRTQTVNEIVLGTNPNKHYVAPDARAALNNSMNWAWAVLEFIPRRPPEGSRRPSLFGLTIPFFERRMIPRGSRVHRSVVDCAEGTGRTPPNLPSDYRIEH